jgi:hypothetical protein
VACLGKFGCFQCKLYCRDCSRMAIQSGRDWGSWQPARLKAGLWNTISINYHLGFTSFGGPPVHFKIVSSCFAFATPRRIYKIKTWQALTTNPLFLLVPRQICREATMDRHSSGRPWRLRGCFARSIAALMKTQYQELFSVCQAFSGPGSTKMHYCINLIHDGFLPALLGFLIWR